MSFITNKNAENIEESTAVEIPTIQPVAEANPADSEHFAKLMNPEELENQANSAETTDTNEVMSLEELQQQFRDSVLRTGFNRNIEKAKEIIKEMKEG